MCLRNWWLTSPWRTVLLKPHPRQGDRAANKLLEMVMVHLGQVQESGNNQSNLWLKLSVMIRYCLWKWVWQQCGLIFGRSQKIFACSIGLYPTDKGPPYLPTSSCIAFCWAHPLLYAWHVNRDWKLCPSFASNWQHIVKLGATTNCAVVIGPVCIRSNFCEGNENDQGQCIFSTVGDLIPKPSHSAE